MPVVAMITERFTAALSATVSTDQQAAVTAQRDNAFATANRVSWHAVFEFGLAGWRHAADRGEAQIKRGSRESL